MAKKQNPTIGKIVNVMIFIFGLIVLPFFFISFLFKMIGMGIAWIVNKIEEVFFKDVKVDMWDLNDKMNDIFLFLLKSE